MDLPAADSPWGRCVVRVCTLLYFACPPQAFCSTALSTDRNEPAWKAAGCLGLRRLKLLDCRARLTPASLFRPLCYLCCEQDGGMPHRGRCLLQGLAGLHLERGARALRANGRRPADLGAQSGGENRANGSGRSAGYRGGVISPRPLTLPQCCPSFHIFNFCDFS